MSAVLTAFSRINSYVSMRVHGNSAHVQFDTPDLPQKFVAVTRLAQGTQITSNFQASASAHLSIPTPLTTERSVAFAFLGDLTRKPQPVFAGTSIFVVHIELYIAEHNMSLGNFTAMDGNRVLQVAKMSDMFNLTTDEFDEDVSRLHCNVYRTSLDRQVYSALGISFDMGFNMTGTGDSDIVLIGAKAVFVT